MSSDKGYIKEIIEEFNVHLKSWGDSDSWGLNEFKTLEDMIFESSKIRIDSNTLKRIFQQRTSSPQLATKNALCIFLGYSSYTEFVINKTKKKETVVDSQKDIDDNKNLELDIKQDHIHSESKIGSTSYGNVIKQLYHKYRFLIIALFIIFGYLIYKHFIKPMYYDYLFSEIKFEASHIRGVSPLTVTFNYDIPDQLIDSCSVVFEESNGDTIQRRLDKDIHTIYWTYVYPGKGMAYLKYGKQTIKTLLFESLKLGWSVIVNEARRDLFTTLPIGKSFTKNGYLSLPKDSIPVKMRTDKMFVSYTFYQNKLVDGNNFTFEARVRNSELDNAIPLSDMMMYVFSDTGIHGFSINNNGYSYIKFISGEKTIKGDQNNLSSFDFDPSNWHIMKIQVVNKKTTFYLDGKIIFKINYKNSLGFANEIILRFKGCGAVDYTKVTDSKNKVVFYKDF